MAVTYEIAPDGRHILVQVDGPMTSDAIKRMFNALVADPRFSPDMPHLVDLTRASPTNTEGFDGVFSTFNMFARAYEGMGATMRCATFAPDTLHFGMARIFQNLCESSDTIVAAIFDDFDAARTCARTRRCPLVPHPEARDDDALPPDAEGYECDGPCGYQLPPQLPHTHTPAAGFAAVGATD